MNMLYIMVDINVIFFFYFIYLFIFPIVIMFKQENCSIFHCALGLIE
jgi:hypothetical protein